MKPREVLRLARKTKITYRHFRKCMGLTDFTEVWLDPAKEVLPTLIHELIHIRYPDLSETKVLRMERKIAIQFTSEDWIELTVILAQQLQKGED